eukprot:541180-Amphidinium_carterae.1
MLLSWEVSQPEFTAFPSKRPKLVPLPLKETAQHSQVPSTLPKFTRWVLWGGSQTLPLSSL